MRLFFQWANGRDDAAIGDLGAFVGRDGGIWNKCDGVGALGLRGWTALGEACQLIGICMNPDVSVGAIGQGLI